MANKKNSRNLTVAVLLSCSCLCMPWYAQAQDNSIHKDDIIHGDDIGNDENHKKIIGKFVFPMQKARSSPLRFLMCTIKQMTRMAMTKNRNQMLMELK